MGKKMSFWTAGVLGVMIAGLVSVNAYALEDKDVVGTWYVNSVSMDGEHSFHPGAMSMEMTFDFAEDGKGEMKNAMGDYEPDISEIEWKIDGDKLLIIDGDDTVEGEYSDGTISMEAGGMNMVISREKEEFVPYVPGKAVKEPDLKDFDGEWHSTLMDAFGMQMPTAAGISDLEMIISISDGKASLTMIESGTETKADLEGDLEDNALVLKSTTEAEDNSEDDSEENYSYFSTDVMRFYLLDDGILCFTTGDSLDAEETEETNEADGDDEDPFAGMDFSMKVYFEKLELVE